MSITVPESIDPTGAADVTLPLLKFFSSVPDGETLSFPANARYRIEGVLYLENRHGLTFEGNGATFFASTIGNEIAPPNQVYRPNWPRKRAQFVFVGGGGITLRNLTIRGSHRNGGTDGDYVAALEGQHGVVLMSVEGAELDRVTITDVYGDFVYLGGKRGEWSRNIHVHDSHFATNGRQGIAITGAEDVLIEGNYLGDMRRTAIDVEPNGEMGGTRRLTLRNNTFGDIRLSFFAGHGKKGYADDVTIEGNRLKASGLKINSNDSVPLDESGSPRLHRNWRIVGNVSEARIGSPVPPIRLWHMDGVTVRENVQPLNARRQMTGARISDSRGVDVGGNVFEGSIREYELVNSTLIAK